MILEGLELGPYGSNCYLIGDETTREGLIIDPGASGESILQRVKALQLTVKTIVVTHGHPDHLGSVKEVKDGTHAEVAIHAGDAPALTLSSRMAAMHGFPPQSVTPDRLLKGGDTVKVGNLSFLVLHTPGHSPGGICLLGDGLVFTGDTLFNMSIGRSDFPGGNQEQLLTSIHTKLMVLPDNTVVYPGHGPESTIGEERRGNPFLRGR